MSYFHLTSAERYVIFHLVLYGLNFREIGRRLNRHHKTISREIKCNRPRKCLNYQTPHEAFHSAMRGALAA